VHAAAPNEASTLRIYNPGVFNSSPHDIAVALIGFVGVTAAASMLPLAALASALRSRTRAYRVIVSTSNP
jgi:hypothetical protein